ncbi:hypothetical protein LZD49_07620 [Dyadobacter sp. CY261]|uniref:hypothetical protein n=1 Tax=Dyadobacter sp. CY261 TaxID=2907203 RepID=UPI001F48C80B|nr:hypothetical protein [Dyadobacter sp. CY261]MCF0070336.1 hypothetical protein [Dyadobacter sp. CY261]
MKTNKFENTIRRKLESIEPDFQEKDWVRMQNYMQAHTPPSFVQQYGSWIGYAAAASVTSVMAYLYVGQLSQNDHLVQDVKSLQSQIEVIRNQPAQIAKTDTVYVLQATPDGQSLQATELAHEFYPKVKPQQPLHVADEPTNAIAAGLPNRAEFSSIERPATATPDKTRQSPFEAQQTLENTAFQSQYGTTNQQIGVNANSVDTQNVPASGNSGRTFGSDFQLKAIENFAEIGNSISLTRKMQYELANKLSNRQVQKALLANMQIAKAAVSGKKTEQVAQAESVIPKLPLKTPYRFGAGFQVEGNGSGKTVLGEVIIRKKFSIAAGITWLKVKPAEFFNETVFREKNRRDFKTTHPGEVPLIFNLYNIKIDQSIVQMPLTLAFRNTVKDDWAYYASMGTNIRLSSKEMISFDCRGPKNEFFNQTISKKGDTSPITSMNFALGIEKSWHPIVVQAEGYWVNYFKAVTPLKHSAGPGLKVKLLYQIGHQM